MNKQYAIRKYIIIFLFILVGIIYLIRLFFLQVIDNEYKLTAQNNVLRYVTQYPARGLIYDRTGELLVYNEAAYDLLVIPRQVKELDTAHLCKLLKITPEDFERRMAKARKFSSYKPSVFLEQISKEDYGYLKEKLYTFKGFYVQARTLRSYPIPIAAHILGFIGEVNYNEIDSDPYYRIGDYIGKSGIEKSYENVLRGSKGVKIKMVDVHNREVGSFQNGKYDTVAVSGQDIYLSIDHQLQAYGEQLMRNKRGSIVAIEPSTGEVLALVSAPNYDPNLLIGRIRTKNFQMLSQDTLKPIFNRATSAQYPPGSTFKTVQSLIGLQEGTLKSTTEYDCDGVLSFPIVCSHDHYAPLALHEAIEQSCNPYFWKAYNVMIHQSKFSTTQEGYNNWREKVASFGIGRTLPGDIVNQRKGNLPESSYFDRYYGKKGWRAITIRSLSIGQGEIEITPLQLANLSATIANRGYYYPPHLFKDIDTLQKRYAAIDEKHYEDVVQGMHLVYTGPHGSARWYRIDSIPMCGKTGTAENPHGENHSVFMAFAPKDDPKIAIAVIVENAGYGSTWAAPIATLMMEQYINGKVVPKWWEDKMLNTNLINPEE